MARRRKKAEDPAADAGIDERDWEDWRRLREELGQRLGGRDAMGESDPEDLAAARGAAKRTRRRR